MSELENELRIMEGYDTDDDDDGIWLVYGERRKEEEI